MLPLRISGAVQLRQAGLNRALTVLQTRTACRASHGLRYDAMSARCPSAAGAAAPLMSLSGGI